MVTPAAVILTILLNLYWEALHVFLAFKVKLISELVSCWCKYQMAALQGRWLVYLCVLQLIAVQQ